ncbi:hypothetical protein DPX16_12416 [Anabarilius grahami]|uniref:Uncharacterized protein n=1 Tax=Anabarilius grahami TaxID=495550 RepID=A0A3N0XG32_ANAGA|nr:hypothetical protein DPX16_12416 [Anabarilius grahami]
MDLINWSLNTIDTIFSTRSLGSGEPDCPAGTFAAGYTMDAWERWRVVCLAALSVEDIEDIYLFGTMITCLLLTGLGFALVYRDNRKTATAVQNLTRLPVMIEAIGPIRRPEWTKRVAVQIECGYSPQDKTIPILSAFGSHQPALASAKAAVGTTTPPEEHCTFLPVQIQSPSTTKALYALQKPNINVYHGDDLSFVSCEILLSVRADFTCSLYTEDVLLYQKGSQKSQSGDHHFCLFYLSPGELLTRSVNSQLSCDYSLNTEPEIRSQRSDTITIRDLPQSKLTASASVIKETDTVQLSCENTEDLKMEMCYFNINGRKRTSKLSSSCQLSLTGSEISIWSEGQSSSVRITCFYTLKKSQVLITSPRSDPVTVQSKFFNSYSHIRPVYR